MGATSSHGHEPRQRWVMDIFVITETPLGSFLMALVVLLDVWLG
jgi:hypothetical protein